MITEFPAKKSHTRKLRNNHSSIINQPAQTPSTSSPDMIVMRIAAATVACACVYSSWLDMAQRLIYFCGSIRGGRDDAALYARIIADLQARFGTVLTEHIGADNLGEHALTDTQIYERDVAWLRASHGTTVCVSALSVPPTHRSVWGPVVIAEVTTPSLGVGYEVGMAVELGKPTLCLFRPASGRSTCARRPRQGNRPPLG
jgi:2'-deoxynucleoside 5'-phosphate N-hydrolase